MARADRQIICGFWSTLACFGLKTQFFVIFCHCWLWKTKRLFCAPPRVSVHHLGQNRHILGAQESAFKVLFAELLSYLELVFSCIQSSFFSRCSWGVWALQNDFLGFWLLWSCSWHNEFPKMEPLDWLRLLLLWFERFLLHSKDCSKSSERFRQVWMAQFGMGIFHFSFSIQTLQRDFVDYWCVWRP